VWGHRLPCRHVRLWHKCEVPAASSNVRFLGHTGRHLLELNSPDFDPKRARPAKHH
jgi:hypothetical protein